MFDNRGYSKKKKFFSRVLSLNPQTMAVEVLFGGEQGQSFYSGLRGGIQIDSNNHLLVMVSGESRVVAFNPTKQLIPWELRIGTADSPRPMASIQVLSSYDLKWLNSAVN